MPRINLRGFYFVAGITFFFLIGFLAVPAYATAANSVTLDRSDSYYIGHGAVVTVDNPDSAPNVPGVADTTTITVKICNSTCTTVYSSCTVTVTENPIDSRIFLSPAMKFLSSGATCPNFNVPTPLPKYIKAEYGITFSLKVPIYAADDENGCSASSPPSATCQKLASSSTFYFPKDSDAIGFSQNFSTMTCEQRYGVGSDDDNDGICDTWESTTTAPGQAGTLNISFTDSGQPASQYILTCGTSTSDLINDCPRNNQYDILVEIDAIKHHKPSVATIDLVKNALESEPIDNPFPIKFFYQLDEEIPFHKTTLSKYSSGSEGSVLTTATDLDRIKAFHFGKTNERNDASKLHAKRQVFHYVMFTHLRTDSTTSSGYAEMPGNDVMISLGAFTQGIGSSSDQAAALMHELGHNLGLNHGGVGDPINCKPNYISIMSYSLEFTNYVSNRELDFSRSALDTLNEGANQLYENAGVSASDPAGRSTVYGPTTPLVRATGQAFDWNRDTDYGDNPLSTSQDINNLGVSDCPASSNSVLVGKDDWVNLDFIFQDWSAGQDGLGFPGDDTLDDDNDEVPNNSDNCPLAENSDQADTDSDGIGDVCDDEDNDNDGLPDISDNCSLISNEDQADTDSDGIGDVCDDDNDNDGLLDFTDNCPDANNPGQEDVDDDGIGDACDTGFIDFEVETDNLIRFIAMDEGSQDNQPLLDDTTNFTTDELVGKEQIESPSSKQQPSDKVLPKVDLVMPDKRTANDISIDISGGFDENDNLNIDTNFVFNNKPVKDVNFEIIATHGDNTILKEIRYAKDGTSQESIKGLESTSPVIVKVTILGIGSPAEIGKWIGTKNNVATFGISGKTPEISYDDVMEMRHQTILYLKSRIQDTPLKPESTKTEILQKMDSIASHVKVKTKIILDDKGENAVDYIINDNLGTAIQELYEVKQGIINSEIEDPKVKQDLIDLVDDRTSAFAIAAEPIIQPYVPLSSNMIYSIVIGVFVAFGVLLFALRAGRLKGSISP